eukprot:gene26979-2532_t
MSQGGHRSRQGATSSVKKSSEGSRGGLRPRAHSTTASPRVASQKVAGSDRSLSRLVATRSTLLFVSKYKFDEQDTRVSDPLAWRICERHIVPAARSHASRYDQYVTNMSGPSTIALILAWEPQIKHLFNQHSQPREEETPVPAKKHKRRQVTHATAAASGGGSDSGTGKSALGRTASEGGDGSTGEESDGGPKEAGNAMPDWKTVPTGGEVGGGRPGDDDEVITLLQFLRMMEDRHVIPDMLEPSDLKEVFRHVEPIMHVIPDLLVPSDLEEVFRRVKPGNGVIGIDGLEPGNGVIGIDGLEVCGLKRNKETQLARSAHASVLGRPPDDPNHPWMDLKFDPEKESKCWSYLSSMDYACALIQPCPHPVLVLLSKAQEHHNEGGHSTALKLYTEAKHVWEKIVAASANPPGLVAELAPEQKM